MDLSSWIKLCLKYRSQMVRNCNGSNEYLLANFKGGCQQKDIEDKASLFHDYFRAWQIFDRNILLSASVKTKQARIKSLSCSDIPLYVQSKLKNINFIDLNEEFIFQLMGCNLACPWCYNDNVKNSFNITNNNGEFYSAEQIVEIFIKYRETHKAHILTSLGGEPSLVPEHWYELIETLKKKGLNTDTCLTSATNLTTGHFWDYLMAKNIIPSSYLDREKIKNLILLCSFKGTDTEGFLYSSGFFRRKGSNVFINKGYAFLEEERWYTFDKLISMGFNILPVLYDPNPKTLTKFIHKGMSRHGEGFLSKLRLGEIILYSPPAKRFRKQQLDPHKIQIFYRDRYNASLEILNNMMQKYFKVNYGDILRSSVVLYPCDEDIDLSVS